MSYKGKVVLAYSGGLDTSVAIKWLMDQGYDVVTFTADVGQTIDLEAAKVKALKTGAVNAYVMDLREEFLQEFVWPSLKANAMYQGTYPLNSALSRPLIAKYLSWIAKVEGAVAVAHGCTGKGQDQVRIEVCVNAIDPELEVLAPVRDWHFSRDTEIEYAKDHGIPIPITLDSPYSLDENMWGRSVECGPLEDPWTEPPADCYALTNDPWDTPDEPLYLEITFEKGVPVAINGQKKDGVDLVQDLDKLAGSYGIGRIDMIEDRLVGFKSREVYECPAATVLIQAHQALEKLTISKEVTEAKADMQNKYAELAYVGYWFSPLREAYDAFFNKVQESVNGTVKVRFYKGQTVVVGLKSDNSLYQDNLATYSDGDAFDHESAKGFITVWGLPVKTWKEVHPNTHTMPDLKACSESGLQCGKEESQKPEIAKAI